MPNANGKFVARTDDNEVARKAYVSGNAFDADRLVAAIDIVGRRENLIEIEQTSAPLGLCIKSRA